MAKKLLTEQTRWARHEAGQWWTLAVNAPPDKELMLWLMNTYEVGQVKRLKSGALALLVRSTSSTVRALMELPKPKGKGSRHECNQVNW